MTARILVDCARVAYAEEPNFEHNSHFGDEVLIRRLIRVGGMSRERRRGEEFDGGDVRALVGRGGGGGEEEAHGVKGSQENSVDGDSSHVRAFKGKL